jgi:hypothetical protein
MPSDPCRNISAEGAAIIGIKMRFFLGGAEDVLKIQVLRDKTYLDSAGFPGHTVGLE